MTVGVLGLGPFIGHSASLFSRMILFGTFEGFVNYFTLFLSSFAKKGPKIY